MYDPCSEHEETRVLGQQSSEGFSARLPSYIWGNQMVRLFVGILTSNLVILSQASSQSLEQFERMSQFEKAMVAVDQIKSRKKLQCLISIKNRSLCECLSTNLPFTLHISNYVSIANQDKGTVDYGQLSTADRQSVDRCVDSH
jgi:hypothetical protein